MADEYIDNDESSSGACYNRIVLIEMKVQVKTCQRELIGNRPRWR